MCKVFGGPHSPEKLMAPVTSGGYGLGGIAMTLRKECIADPLVLMRDVLSYGRDRTYWENPTFEHRAASAAMVAYQNFLLLMPRNHGKTTLVDEGGTVHELLRRPDSRILCAQATHENAKAISGQVRGHFVSNRVLRELFPEYAMDGEQNILAWNVPCRRANTREASVELGTPGTSLAGRHYDLINGSDLMNEQNCPPPAGVGSHEEMAKTTSWFGTLSFLLDRTNPEACTRLDGTRYHDSDLYGKIIRKGATLVIQCGIKDDADGRPVPIWDKMSREALISLRAEPLMSAAKWAAQMKNDPLPGDNVGFNRTWFRGFRACTETEVLPAGVVRLPDQLDLALTIDPAYTEQDKNPEADRSALVVSGVSPLISTKDGIDIGGDIYIPAWRAGRWTPRELIEQIHALYAVWHPRWVGLESGAQSVGLRAMFLEDMARTGRWLPLRDMPPKGQNKTVRAMPLRAHAERKGIYVAEADLNGEFVDEFVRFPVGEHDDLVDALAYRALDMHMPWLMQQAAEPPRIRRIVVPRGIPAEELINALHDPDYESPWFSNIESAN